MAEYINALRLKELLSASPFMVKFLPAYIALINSIVLVRSSVISVGPSGTKKRNFEYETNVTLVCDVAGYPAPSVEWKNSEKNVGRGRKLWILLLKAEQVFWCYANNTIKGQKYVSKKKIKLRGKSV